MSERGYYIKYFISKTNGNPVDDNADYFVLRLDTDLAARQAVMVYADLINNRLFGRELKASLILGYHEGKSLVEENAEQRQQLATLDANAKALRKSSQQYLNHINKIALTTRQVREENKDLRQQLAVSKSNAEQYKELAKLNIDKYFEVHDKLAASEASNVKTCNELARQLAGLVKEKRQMEASNAAMHGALEFIQNETKEGYGKDGKIRYVAFQALSTTPDEVAQRVQGLVDALEVISNGYACKFKGETVMTVKTTNQERLREIAQKALAAYRGLAPTKVDEMDINFDNGQICNNTAEFNGAHIKKMEAVINATREYMRMDGAITWDDVISALTALDGGK